MRREVLHVAALAVLLTTAGACSDAALSPTEPELTPTAEFARGGKGKPGGDVVTHDFEVLDPSLWEPGNHPLGRGWFRPANVSAVDGNLELRIPAGGYDGGEIRSTDRPRGGVFEARIQAARAPGSLTAFFLYEFTESNIDEVDIEILGDGSGRVLFTTWLRSRQTNHSEVQLPFDPTADFHTYRIELTRKSVSFFVDDALVERFTRDIPWAAMHVMANTWYPTWLSGGPQSTDEATRIDWIRY